MADRDLIAARITHAGSNRGSWKGVPPTGHHIEIDEMYFFRFQDGLLVEVWEVTDEQAMWYQLGGRPG